KHGLGIVLGALEPERYREAARALVALVRDPELPLRAHGAARAHYDLAAGVARQVELVRGLVAEARARGTLPRGPRAAGDRGAMKRLLRRFYHLVPLKRH